MLHEIRWHGRAGQGIITASRILAHAAVLDGKHAQATPEFGPERLGAPISGFTRISNEPILIHSQIYRPNAVIVLDKSLLKIVDVNRGITEDGILLINARKLSDIESPFKGVPNRVYTVNADELSRKITGKLAPDGRPAAFRGDCTCGARKITDSICVAVAREIAHVAEEQGVNEDYILPRMEEAEVF